MTPGDKVYLNQRGQWLEYTFINAFDWQDAVQIRNGLGLFTCKASELITKEAYDKLVDVYRQSELRLKHASLIELWGNGPEKPTEAARRRLVAKCAQELDCSASGLGRTLAMLGRYGLIKYGNDPAVAKL